MKRSLCIRVFLNLQPTGRGLAMWWYLKNVRPALLLIRNKKATGNKQIPIRIPSAQTEVDSDQKLKLPTSRHHIAKPFVNCRFFFAFLEQKNHQRTTVKLHQTLN